MMVIVDMIMLVTAVNCYVNHDNNFDCNDSTYDNEYDYGDGCSGYEMIIMVIIIKTSKRMMKVMMTMLRILNLLLQGCQL